MESILSQDKNQQVLGHVWVSAQVVVAGYSYPMDWARYRRQSECEQNGAEFVSKPDLALSARTILASYLTRWKVENFYRAAKQILGWGNYQMRDLQAIENHVLRMMVTHAYIEIQRRDTLEVSPIDAHFTLGGLQREHQQMAQRSTIALVFSLCRQGFALSDIYERLAV